jgi:hypothetical protein
MTAPAPTRSLPQRRTGTNGVAATDIYVDHASGARASRPQLDTVLRMLRKDDTLKITRLDRLGRSVLHLVTQPEWAGDTTLTSTPTSRRPTSRPPGAETPATLQLPRSS